MTNDRALSISRAHLPLAHGFAYSYCLATGLAFLLAISFLAGGDARGGPTSRFWHPMLGLVFFAAQMWMHHIWRGDVNMGPADKEWLDKSKYYVTNQDDKVPAQGKFNAGQSSTTGRCSTARFCCCSPARSCGFPNIFRSTGAGSARWSFFIHEGAALITIGAFIIHVYMSVFMVPGSVEAIGARFRLRGLGQNASSPLVRPGRGTVERWEMRGGFDRRIARAQELPGSIPRARICSASIASC